MSSKDIVEIKIADVIYREDLYPRMKPDSDTITKYAECIEQLPPIQINQHNILIDGCHRLKAHESINQETIRAEITHTETENELFRLAARANAKHGLQYSRDEKKKLTRRLYDRGNGDNKEDIANLLSITLRTVNNYLSDIDKDLRKERKQKIADMWMACYTQEEIAKAVGLDSGDKSLRLSGKLENFPNNQIIRAKHMEDGFDIPKYNVWTFGKKTNSIGHFGNSEQRIVDNLLYLYTKPFDIVLDPFAGGGSTIDICKKRSRRYWVSDRKPIIARENEIRKHDIVTDGLPPLHKRWQDVSLTYLDPPYWRQAAGQYSNDATDLANMPLGQFHDTLKYLVEDIAEKQKTGHIALLIQPTQWKADNKQFTDHVMWLCSRVSLELENRVSCPYSTEQYNAQMVNYAKEHHKLLVISRELIIWKVG
jgi:transcriptional regulator with XRE-family HTH domain